MSNEPLFSTKNEWFVRSVAVTAAVFIVTALGGFVLLPYLQPDLRLGGLWDAICSAAGVVRQSAATASVKPDFKTSMVIMTSDMLRRPGSEIGWRRCDLGSAVRDLSWSDRREPGRIFPTLPVSMRAPSISSCTISNQARASTRS